MRLRIKNNFVPCFKCGQRRKPSYGIWAFKVPATASKPPKGDKVAEDALGMIFQAFGGISLSVIGGVSGLPLEDAADPLSDIGAKATVWIGKKVLKLGKDDTIRKKVHRPKTIKAPKFQTGGMIYRLFDTRKKWMCDGPAYQGLNHKINRRFKKQSRLQKYFEQTILGKKHRKRSVHYVCLDCFKTLTGQYPTPGRGTRVPLSRRIDQIKKAERGALGRTRTKARY